MHKLVLDDTNQTIAYFFPVLKFFTAAPEPSQTESTNASASEEASMSAAASSPKLGHSDAQSLFLVALSNQKHSSE